jgi:hypothetical protein
MWDHVEVRNCFSVDMLFANSATFPYGRQREKCVYKWNTFYFWDQIYIKVKPFFFLFDDVAAKFVAQSRLFYYKLFFKT